MSRDEAIEALAMELARKQEHLDPIALTEWEDFDEREKDYYRQSVQWLLLHPDLLFAAIGETHTV